MIKALLLAFLLVGSAPEVIVVNATVSGGGGGTDYTADAEFYELWDFNDSSTATCDGVVNSNDLSEDGTIVHATGNGNVEGAAALDNNNGPNGCSGSLTSAPSGAWTMGLRWYPTEGPTNLQSAFTTNGNSNNFLMRANSASAVDWRINSTNINNQHTYAINTQYSVIVAYDGTDLTFWWDGGSGNGCTGSTYTSALDPGDFTSIQLGNANAGDWGGVMDEVWIAGDVFTQADACAVFQDGIDGAGLP